MSAEERPAKPTAVPIPLVTGLEESAGEIIATRDAAPPARLTWPQPEWDEEVEIGKGVKVDRPLNDQARRLTDALSHVALALHDRLEAVEAKLREMEQ